MKASVLNFAIVIYYWFYLLLTVHISWELHGVLYGFGNSFAVIMVYKWYTNVVFLHFVSLECYLFIKKFK